MKNAGCRKGSRTKASLHPRLLPKTVGGAGRTPVRVQPALQKEVKPRMTHPDGTGYIRGLYTFDDVSAEIRDFLEQKFFLKADDRAHVALKLLLTDQLDFDAPTRGGWSRFLMTLLHRNPEGIERTRRRVIEGLPEILRRNYDSIRDRADSNTVDEFVASLTNRDIDTTTLIVLNKIMDSGLVGMALNRMGWGVIRVNRSRYPLLTSDRLSF